VRAPSLRTPSYRLHKPTGQAVVTLNGRDIYLGKHGTLESRAAYDRTIAEWLAQGRSYRGADGRTINEVVAAYLSYVDGYYTSAEPACIRLSLRPLRALYGSTPASEFGPLKLKIVRQAFIDAELCRAEVNKRTRRIVRMFKWAVAEELIAASVHHALKAVDGIRRGREGVRESKPVRPVADNHVDAIQPYVAPQIWAMIELQRLTGARPGEICSIRTIDIDRSGQTWVYRPESHKTAHHGKERVIHLGPQAQTILKPWLRADPTAYLFQPREVDAARRAAQRLVRKSKVQPSQLNRKKAKPKRTPSEVYKTYSYRQAIQYGIEKANRLLREQSLPEIPMWHPHQLRHSAATRLRREFGLDTARAVLGHSTPVVTEVYAELDAAKASEAMAKIG
jgi:integrase